VAILKVILMAMGEGIMTLKLDKLLMGLPTVMVTHGIFSVSTLSN